VAIADFFGRGREALHRVVVGNDETIDGLLTALVLEGHVLLEGPPGTAKTLRRGRWHGSPASTSPVSSSRPT
jgi:MoxR-like ATPase